MSRREERGCCGRKHSAGLNGVLDDPLAGSIKAVSGKYNGKGALPVCRMSF